MGWICETCSKRKTSKCDFMTNDNCYKPNTKARIKNLLSRIFKIKLKGDNI